MPRTTIAPAFSVAGRMPSRGPARPRCQGPDYPSTPQRSSSIATDDAIVLLWGDRHELRRALADARARLAGLEAQLADRARTDACTGLLTLEAFCGDAEAVLAHAARAEQPASLALVDIDGFRSLNARRGPAAGDAALIAVAERLRALTRASDVLGRTGADELAVLMPGTPVSGARTCCERLIAELDARRHPARGLHHGLGRRGHASLRHHDRAPAGRRRARAGPRPRRRRRPRRGAPGRGRREPLPRPGARHRGAGHRARRARPLHRRALRLRRRHGQDRRPTRSASTRSRSSASATPPCCTTSARSGCPTASCTSRARWPARSGTLMREHPVIGERILRAIPGMGCVARIVRHEHERFDGTRLPRRARRRGDPARQPDHPRLRRLPRDDLRSPLPRGDAARARGRRAGALRGLAVRPADRRGARRPPARRRRPVHRLAPTAPRYAPVWARIPTQQKSIARRRGSRAARPGGRATSWPATAPRPTASRRASRCLLALARRVGVGRDERGDDGGGLGLDALDDVAHLGVGGVAEERPPRLAMLLDERQEGVDAAAQALLARRPGAALACRRWKISSTCASSRRVELALGGEVLVDEGLRDARRLRDVLERRAVVAAAGEDLLRAARIASRRSGAGIRRRGAGAAIGSA